MGFTVTFKVDVAVDEKRVDHADAIGDCRAKKQDGSSIKVLGMRR